jgi:hypothetical protein
MRYVIGVFLPMKINCFSQFKFKLSSRVNLKKFDNMNCDGPFFRIENENSAVESFLDAIINSELDEAKKFISSEFSKSISLKVLEEKFRCIKSYKCLLNNQNIISRKKYIIGSVLLIDKKCNTGVVDFHLLNQPDSFSKWKICAVT